MPKHDLPKKDRPLAPKELLFVTYYEGNQIEAAKRAGYKFPKAVASTVFNRPAVRAAIEKKQAAFFAKLGVSEARGVKITRNDIINRLDELSQNAETDSARVMALRELKDIFGLSVRHANNDIFAGWTDEELDSYRKTGELPPRFRSPMGSGASDVGNPATSAV